MSIFKEDDVRKLLLDTLEEHSEIDLVVVAKVFIEQKIIRDLIDKEHYRDEDAIREGRKLQRKIEEILLVYAEELEKQGKLKLDFKAMKIESL